MNFEISELTFILTIVLRIITAIIFLTLVIPLVLKEAMVRNGLRTLRYEMLFTTSIIFLVSTSGLFIVLFRKLGFDTQVATNTVALFNSVGFLAYFLAKRRIYTQEYSPRNKERHARLADMEEAEDKELTK